MAPGGRQAAGRVVSLDPRRVGKGHTLSVARLVEGVYRVPLGVVNAYQLDRRDVRLVDTGIPGTEAALLDTRGQLEYRPEAVHPILVTHLHADHSGGLRRLKEATGAPAYTHRLDAEAVRQGMSARPTRAAPGLLPWLIPHLFMRLGERPGIQPTEAEHELDDGQVLSFAGDLEVVHVPGHAAGQVALRLPEEGILFAADAASHNLELGNPPIFEDQDRGWKRLAKLVAPDVGTACLGHGAPMQAGADKRFREKWA